MATHLFRPRASQSRRPRALRSHRRASPYRLHPAHAGAPRVVISVPVVAREVPAAGPRAAAEGPLRVHAEEAGRAALQVVPVAALAVAAVDRAPAASAVVQVRPPVGPPPDADEVEGPAVEEVPVVGDLRAARAGGAVHATNCSRWTFRPIRRWMHQYRAGPSSSREPRHLNRWVRS